VGLFLFHFIDPKKTLREDKSRKLKQKRKFEAKKRKGGGPKERLS